MAFWCVLEDVEEQQFVSGDSLHGREEDVRKSDREIGRLVDPIDQGDEFLVGG